MFGGARSSLVSVTFCFGQEFLKTANNCHWLIRLSRKRKLITSMGGIHPKTFSFASSVSSLSSSMKENTPSFAASTNKYNEYQKEDDDDNDNHDDQHTSSGKHQQDEKSTKSQRRRRIQEVLSAFWDMTKIYFYENSEGRWMFVGLVVLMILNSAVRVFFSYLARDFWTALSDQNVDEFFTILYQFLIALLILAPINVFFRFQKQRLAIRWRTWMTTRILTLYYQNQIFYKLERSIDTNPSSSSSQENEDENHVDSSTSTNHPNVDNPDQRITEDVRSFTQYSLSLFITLAMSTIDLAAFSVILYTIKPQLFVSIIGFATFGTVLTVVIGRRLVDLNYQRLTKEANFRYSLVRFRDNAESIAFFGGEYLESNIIQRRFASVIANAYEVIGTQRNLDFFTTLYNYLTWILPIVVIAPDYFAGVVELGVIQQSTAAFSHILDDLSVVINEFEGLTEFSASIGRLHQFLRQIQNLHPSSSSAQGDVTASATTPLLSIPKSNGHDHSDGGDDGRCCCGCCSSLLCCCFGTRKNSSAGSGDGIFKETKDIEAAPVTASSLSTKKSTTRLTIDLIESPTFMLQQPSSTSSNRLPPLCIQNLKLFTPDNSARILIANLNLQLEWNQNLLIVGASGVGKSSLLRAIAGLWTSGSGVIKRANRSDIYFVPQKPCKLCIFRCS